MPERRFSETEVAAIFARATNAQESDEQISAESGGLSLAQLQEIGREVGLAPDLIVQAALSIDTGGRPTSRTFLGLPIGVGRTVELGRKLSEEEWERLVVDLRDTFDARGVVHGAGSLRQWTNGNLQALLEPTATGHRLRLRTFKRDAQTFTTVGLILVGASIAVLLMEMLRPPTFHLAAAMPALTIGAMGAGLIASGTLRLSSWARTRRQQMEDIVSRLMRTTQVAPLPDTEPNAPPRR